LKEEALMKIEVIGTRGWSYAGMEDLVREFGPRFIRDGHKFTIHSWATDESLAKGISSDVIQNDVRRIFHKTTHGKFSGQMIVALKASWSAALSDCDIIYYAFIQNGIYSWIPRLFGKKIFSNVNGIMWKDPKWPWGFRQIFFVLGAYLTYFFSNKTITDSFHMQALYRKKFKLKLGWVGYGCSETVPEKKKIDLCDEYPDGYYIIMSRQTPHNLTDLLVEGFIRSDSKQTLLLAGHIPSNKWFQALQLKAKDHRVRWLGLIKDQEYLTQVLLNAKAYMHGHSLGGINPALVRVTGLNVPTICIDTIYNREVVEDPNKKLQALMFSRDANAVSTAIQEFEKNKNHYLTLARELGETIREKMSWEKIYLQYKKYMEDCFK
jgi:glycosyltransferase involved in cell wall biosynthesis